MDVDGDDTAKSDEESKIAITLQDLMPRINAIRCAGKVRSFDFSPFLRSAPSATVAGGASEQFRILCGLANNQLDVYVAGSPLKDDDEAAESAASATRLEVSIEEGHRADIRAMAVSSDDVQIATCSTDAVKVWNAETRRAVTTITSDAAKAGGGGGYPLCCAFVPGNNHLIVGTKEGRLDLYDLAAATLLESFAAHSGPVWSVQVWPDRRGLTSGSADKEVKFWDFALAAVEEGGAVRKQLTLNHSRTLRLTDDVLCVRHSHDNRFLAVALLDATVKVFYADTLKFYVSLYGHRLPVLSMDISSDSTLIATASADKNIKIWGLDFGDCHRSLRAHEDSVMACKFVFGTHHIFSVGKDRMVKYWDGDKFEQIQKLPGHHGEVWALAVAKYGAFVATASHDKSIRLWEKTEEQFTIEEEREKEIEEIFDQANLETAQQPDDIERPIGSGVDPDNPLGGVAAGAVPEVGRAQRTTSESLRAGDRILEALEVWEEEREGDRLHEAEVEKWRRGGENGKMPRRPPRSPYVVASLSEKRVRWMEDRGLESSKRLAFLYVLHVFEGIKTPDLEQALLVLPFPRVMQLLEILAVWAEKEWNNTLTSRVLNILLRLHHDSLVATRAARPHLRRLRETLRPALARYRDMIGFNLAALGYMRREWEAEHTAIDGGEIVGAEDFFGGRGTGFDGGDLEGDEKRGEKGKKGVKRKKEATTRVVVKG
ncbi:hypothetical protein HDU96_002376 [Phlyctochytrium bullatum]|nr:hypothetical protein HDU96_002376 [Phlyctochytrium bullatum]